MLRGLAVLLTYMSMFAYGLRVPAVFALAYIWTDLFRPQYVASGIISTLPLSMICGVVSIIALAFCRERAKRVTAGTALLVVWTLWMTITTTWAEVPDAAWVKWDWAFKAAIFSILLPYFFNSREEIEAALLTVLVAIVANIIPVGLKTIVSGGGYGVDLGLVGGTAGITEGSTLAMVAASVVPLYVWVAQHSVLIPWPRLRKLSLLFVGILSMVASLGTFARTGLVAVGVLVLVGFFKTRRKFLYALLVMTAVGGLQGFMGDQWSDRMSTMKGVGSESSAMGRVAVWLWTIDYVKEHPFGGGFEAYRINSGAMELDDGSVMQFKAKAFHSIYFETLGEHGIPGLLLFLTTIVWSLLSLGRVRKLSRQYSELAWAGDAASALRIATVIFLVGGAFIGVAYQPYFWFLFGIGIALRHFADRTAMELFLPIKRDGAVSV